jgi:hypothetical protein
VSSSCVKCRLCKAQTQPFSGIFLDEFLFTSHAYLCIHYPNVCSNEHLFEYRPYPSNSIDLSLSPNPSKSIDLVLFPRGNTCMYHASNLVACTMQLSPGAKVYQVTRLRGFTPERAHACGYDDGGFFTGTSRAVTSCGDFGGEVSCPYAETYGIWGCGLSVPCPIIET